VEREPIIRGLTIQGFRSIANERIELDNPTFLVGRNGSGKSNIVDALAFLGEAMFPPLQGAISSRGGLATVLHQIPGASYPRDLGFRVEFDASKDSFQRGWYAFSLRAESERLFSVERETCRLTGASFDRQGGGSLPTPELPYIRVNSDALLLPAASGIDPFAWLVFVVLSKIRRYNIDPNQLRQRRPPDNGQALYSDGSNAASVLQEIRTSSREDFQTICELLTAALPYEIEVRAVPYGSSQLGLEIRQKVGREEITLEAVSASDGTLRLLGLLLAVFQPQTPSVLVIEEPEASVHPEAFGVVLDLLRLAARRTQVIVTTHSPELLDAKWIEERHLRVVTWEDGSTRVQRLSEGSKRVLQAHLAGAGELLRTGSLDAVAEPAALPLFAG
jgi:predicted ATPase